MLQWICSTTQKVPKKTHKKQYWQLLIITALTTFSLAAASGGLEFPGIGTEASARGGAFVAKATGGSAFIYNPAGLAKSTQINLLFSIQLVHLQLDYRRQGSGGYWLDSPANNWSQNCPNQTICIADPNMDYGFATNGAPFSKTTMSSWAPLPLAVLNWGNFAGIDGLSVSIGLVPPSAFGTFSLPSKGAQRYSLIRSSHFVIFPGVGIAYRIHPKVHVGAVFMSGIARLNQSLKIRPLPSMASTRYNENIDGDAFLETTAQDWFIPTATMGILVTPKKWLELGLSARLPAFIGAKGKMHYQAPSNDMALSYMPKTKNDITLKQHFPLHIRFGARYIGHRFDVEADVTFENWASLSGFDIIPDAIIIDPINEQTQTETAMPKGEIPKNFRNTYSAHIGSSIALLPGILQLHLGAFFQSSAYPKNNSTFNIDVPFATQIGASGGLSVLLGKRIKCHLAFLHIFQPRVTVKKGIVQQQGLPLSTGENIGNTINNGTYDVAINILGLSGEYQF